MIKLRIKLLSSPLFLIFFSLFIIELLGYKFLTKDAKKKLVELDKKIGNLEKRLSRLQLMNSEIKNFEEERLEMEGKTIRFGELIPHTIDQVKLLQELKKIAEVNKIKNLTINILEPQQTDTELYRLVLKISCEAKFQNIGRFLNELDKFGQLLCIEELEIKRNPDIVPYLEMKIVVSMFQSSSET